MATAVLVRIPCQQVTISLVYLFYFDCKKIIIKCTIQGTCKHYLYVYDINFYKCIITGIYIYCSLFVIMQVENKIVLNC